MINVIYKKKNYSGLLTLKTAWIMSCSKAFYDLLEFSWLNHKYLVYCHQCDHVQNCDKKSRSMLLISKWWLHNIYFRLKLFHFTKHYITNYIYYWNYLIIFLPSHLQSVQLPSKSTLLAIHLILLSSSHCVLFCWYIQQLDSTSWSDQSWISTFVQLHTIFEGRSLYSCSTFTNTPLMKCCHITLKHSIAFGNSQPTIANLCETDLSLSGASPTMYWPDQLPLQFIK